MRASPLPAMALSGILTLPCGAMPAASWDVADGAALLRVARAGGEKIARGLGSGWMLSISFVGSILVGLVKGAQDITGLGLSFETC